MLIPIFNKNANWHSACRFIYPFISRIIVCIALFFLPGLHTEAQIRINELGIAPTVGDAAGGGEFIELFNQGGCNGAVDISCYVIMYTGTSGGGNPTGWSITIPAGTILPACSYYLIGGSGISPNPAWTAIAIGGNAWINSYGANGRAADLDISTASNSGMQSLRPGNLVNTKGQVTIYDAAGGIVTSVSYNAGHNPASFAGSFSNPAAGCTAISPFTNPGAAVNDVTSVFSSVLTQGIYLTSAGNYLAETDLTPGKSNTLNGGTQICCNPTITLSATAQICYSNLAQTVALPYIATTNSPTTYSITWNAAPVNSFVPITNAALPASPIIVNIPANTPAGTYTGYITVANSSGCTSCLQPFTITIKPAGTSTTNINICVFQLPFVWNGFTCNTAGTFPVHISTASGCDSIATLVLTVSVAMNSMTLVSVCPSQLPYSWNGNTYNAQGLYSVLLVSAAGCDSIASLTLEVRANSNSTTTVSVCPSQLPYTWNGNTYNSTGTYSVTLVNNAACDSVATLVFTVKNNTSSTNPVSICPAQLPYIWNGNSYNSAGTYSITLVNAAGCDSVASLQLSVNNNSSSNTSVSVCSNQLPYTWNGNTYNTAGNYTIHFTNAGGCDSAATLALSIKSSSASSTSLNICANQVPFNWNGQLYNAAGIYTVTLMNAAGCDSVATLNLQVSANSTGTSNVSVCQSQLPYTWNGSLYSIPGSYQFTLMNTAGCDSVAILNLTVKTLAPPPTLGNDTTICPLEDMILSPGNYSQYLWMNFSTGPVLAVTHPGLYSVTVTDNQGCSGTASIDIQFFQTCNDIYFPTAITPNHDGLNDQFGALGNLYTIRQFQLYVYNRNGELVFSTNNPFQQWNGYFKNRIFGNTNFVWYAVYQLNTGITKRKKGNLAVIQ